MKQTTTREICRYNLYRQKQKIERNDYLKIDTDTRNRSEMERHEQTTSSVAMRYIRRVYEYRETSSRLMMIVG